MNGPAVHDRFFGFAWAHSPDAASAAGRFVNRPYGIICLNSFLQGCIIQVQLYAKKKRTDYSVPFSQKLRSSLRLGGKLVLADAAELAGKIVGQVFPLGALLVLIIDPAAYIAAPSLREHSDA